MARSATADAAQTVTILSPAKGWVVPLDAVPDPAFASGALGEGVGVELLDELICAPCDARVAAIATSRHAVTLETAVGARILIHCGIDTVALEGAPFTMLVAEGARIAAGDPLMRVDLDAVARAGKSLATPIVLVEPAGHKLAIADRGSRICERGDALFSIEEGTGGSVPVAERTEFTASRDVTLPMRHGLHARPCAAIAAEAAKWAGPVAIVLGGKRADARSTTALMKLGAMHGALLTVEAGGKDADAAASAVAALIEAGAGDGIAAPAGDGATAVPTTILKREDGPRPRLPEGVIGGVAAAPGQALGAAHILHRAKTELRVISQGPSAERARLAQALSDLRDQLGQDRSGPSAAIAAAHRAILDDPELASSIDERISAGASAAVAWQAVLSAEAASIAALSDSRLAERADDFRDLEQQLIRILSGEEASFSVPANSVVIAQDLYPSDFRSLAKAGVAGIATMRGGATSHIAILAASAGIPMGVAFGQQLCEVEEGEQVHLDGERGQLRRNLSAKDHALLAEALERRAEIHAQALDASQDETYLASGERIEVFANVATVADAQQAVSLGAEGSGLVRTEMLFLDRASPPSEHEQSDIYRAIIDLFGEKPVVIRTLDIGADKPAPYLPLDAEDNPALGVRGIRIGLRYPDLLKTQLRAILRAAGTRTAHVMAPMVASVDEVATLRRMVDEVSEEMGPDVDVKLGAMIETPASALIASALATRLDFLSVGTNDLTQYTLAVDRTNSELASMHDPMHPAVLRLIALAGEACRTADCQLGVCGSAAGDHTAAAVLVGLGATELSASAARIPELKQHLRRLTLSQCREAATQALAAATAEEARAIAERVLIRERED